MGYTMVQTNESPKDFLSRTYHKCIYSHVASNVFYGAFKSEDKVFAVVIPFKKQGNTLFYKVMDESVCPIYTKANKKLMSLLTETDNELSLMWREKVSKALSKVKIKEGDTVIFKNPIKFNKGFEFAEFIKIKGKNAFSVKGLPYVFKISNYQDFEYTVA